MKTLPPIRQRVRRTPGSKTLLEFINRHGLKPVAVYVPLPLHRALAQVAIRGETSLQTLFTLACQATYGLLPRLPPLLAPTRTKQDPHKSVTWYADVDLHKEMKTLAVEVDGSVQQLILSAVVEYLKEAPEIKALGLETGHAAYAKTPRERPELV